MAIIIFLKINILRSILLTAVIAVQSFVMTGS